MAEPLSKLAKNVKVVLNLKNVTIKEWSYAL